MRAKAGWFAAGLTTGLGAVYVGFWVKVYRQFFG